MREVITPSRDTVHRLSRRPEFAAVVARPVPSREAVLEEVLRSSVIPQLWSLHCHRPAGATDLAALLLRGDVEAAVALIGMRALLPLHVTLFEPAARRLGDLCMNDECTEFDVTLGLCTLQSAVRRCEERLPLAATERSAGAALVVVQPGELHGLSASLSAHALRRSGWRVACDFPDSDAELADGLAEGWFDQLDLALSPALPRPALLPEVARTIGIARRASRNPKLRIRVSGRSFRERIAAASEVGADA